ncbi:MAG: TaqI-like C-terminal specificity domain-containing protein [Spirochaetota bacterium]
MDFPAFEGDIISGSKQLLLFETKEPSGISINSAAKKANVSNVTIRNWVKGRYLKQFTNGLISIDSLDCFLNTVAGSEKLNSRANKSFKDNHNHEELVKDVLLKLENNNTDFEHLSNEYESALSDSYKNKEGIYYTPEFIIKDLLDDFSGFDNSNLTFCDPCCGTGNFIIEAINIGFKPENIFGFDTDPVAVEITKKRIKEKTGFDSDNIKNADFLTFITKHQNIEYDFIFTNPPWGKKILKDDRKYLGKFFNIKKCMDTCALFFIASLNCLKKDGVSGFLLPESFFNISTFETARKKALGLNVLRIVDYGRAFKGLVTKAQAIIVKNNKAENYFVACEYGNKKFNRSRNSFMKTPESIFNFYCSDKETEVIEHIYSFPHFTLENNAKWGLGIVTGNNSKYCVNNKKDGYMPVYKGADITKNGVKNPSLFISKDMSLYQQVAPVELYESKEKLIYKFISSNLCFFYDTEQRYILNSANMLVLNENQPISNKELLYLLNSDIINWIFSKIFNTFKVLRGDLEKLPIHYAYFSNNNDFSEEKYLDYLKLERTPDGSYKIKT